MWSLFKDKTFVVDGLIKIRTCCGGYNENVIMVSSIKIFSFMFIKGILHQ